MRAYLKSKNLSEIKETIQITGSKSESNRLLLLQGLYPNIKVENVSESDDTLALINGIKETKGIVDIHHAGTAMRFLTAYYASKENTDIILTGSNRMKERPIKILVDALRDLGADITYLKNEGFPPLKIRGKKLAKSEVSIKANVSSQYISALMLVGGSLTNGLTIYLKGEVTSIPYIKMTLSLLTNIGIESSFKNDIIKIAPTPKLNNVLVLVESDWSSASYFYSVVALSRKASITLNSYSEKSLQGDATVKNLYEALGVNTTFNNTENSITISKSNKELPNTILFHLIDTPDLAQTIAVTCFGLGIGCKLTGLHTLKIKETDRLLALKTELEKLGASVTITEDSLELLAAQEIKTNILIDTYQDHRMAMAFAPLSVRFPIVINDAMVVTKSFPTYWADIQKAGILCDFQ
jgi:3-phosphoshikimate 1-carboxyvinyltransferase